MSDMLYGLEGLNLTPQEINKVIYHRQNMANPFITPEGNPMTIYSTGIQIPEGKNKGKKNETTHFEQACNDAKSRWDKKKNIDKYTEELNLKSTNSITSSEEQNEEKTQSLLLC